MITSEDLMELAFRFAAMTRRSLMPPPPPDAPPPPPMPNMSCPVPPPPPPRNAKSEMKHGHGRLRVLFTLLEGDGVTQIQIAERLGIRAPSLSETLLKLEEEALIERRPNESDRRQRFVYLTEKGRSACESFRDQKIARAENFFSPLTDDEKEQLAQLILKLVER